MSRHRAEDGATTTVATQTAHPTRTMLRTMVQTAIPAFLAFAVIVPDIVQEILAQFGHVMPEGLRVQLLAVAAGITGLATLISKLMSMPRVVEFSRKYLKWFAPDDKPVEPPVVAG
ncbi:membrane protein [Arthrobacter phage Wyborn]|uniref:Membrane protein n=1 Tax=Arthrobacter phage Wyborn TaxID=3059067 RepID=A0AA96GVH0_9CAUD|nr:membrane protein [Arthrobacter phage Wyborn]